VAPGAITWAGATDIVLSGTSGTTVNVDVPGAVTWTGQQVGLKFSIAVTPGAVTWLGQTVGLVETIVPTPGALTWAGQAVSLKTFIATQPGSITWTGQDVTVGGPVTDILDQVAVAIVEAKWTAELVAGAWNIRPPGAKWVSLLKR
jgi:hypothetical protein